MVGECGRQRKMYREVCVGGRFIEMRIVFHRVLYLWHSSSAFL